MKMQHPKTKNVVEVTDAQFEVWKANGWRKADDDAVTTAEQLRAARSGAVAPAKNDDTAAKAEPSTEAATAEIPEKAEPATK